MRIEAVETQLSRLPLPGGAWQDAIQDVTHIELVITDVTAVKAAGGDTAFVRPMFQGKLTADVVPQGPGPHFVTFQIGAYRADQAARGPSPAPVRALEVKVDASAIREKPEAPFQQKPFSPEGLARKVREMLDSRKGQS